MKHRKFFSAIVIITLLSVGFLANFVGLAQAATADLGNNTLTVFTAEPGLALPPGIPLAHPLLDNTPVLTITKTAPQQINAGEALTYTVIVANGSITDATGTVITDFLDNNVSFAWASDGGAYNAGDDAVIWDTDTISGNRTITRTMLVTVGADVANGIDLSNTVEVNSTEGASDSDTITTTVNTEADVSISKVAALSTVTAGETLTYTLTITNNGPSDAQNVVVTDTLPLSVSVISTSLTPNNQNGQKLGWALNTLASKATQTITVVVEVDGLVRGSIDNTATITSTTADPDMDNNSKTINTDVDAEADLILTKADTNDPIHVLSNPLIYKLTITNTGPSDATGVVLTDTLPAAINFSLIGSTPGCSEITSGIVTCNLGTIASGESKIVTIYTTLTQPGIFTNQAEVTANEFDPNETDNEDTEETTVQPANLSITKSDLEDPVLIGYPLTYNLTVYNYGPNDATNVTITDTLPQNVTFNFVSSSLTCNHVGGTVTCSMPILNKYSSAPPITIVVTPTVLGTIVNTAGVTADQPDTTPANNIITETTTIDPVTDLSISKIADPDPVIAGESLTYTLTITNGGPSDVTTGITVTDLLSNDVIFISADLGCNYNSNDHSVICTLPSLVNGDTHTFVINVNVASSKKGDLNNYASVIRNEHDPDNDNDSTFITTTVETEADLSISKSANPDPAIPGDNLIYTLTVINDGPSDAANIVVTDTLPSGVIFNSGVGCTDQGGGVVKCTLLSLTNGNNHIFTLNTSLDSSITTPLTNEAEVTSDEPDPDGASTTLYTTVQPEADLEVVQTVSPPSALPGDYITYTLTVFNHGPSDSTGFVLTATLPASVTYQTSSTPACNHNSDTVICNLGSLVNGDNTQVTIMVKVNDSTSGQIVGSAEVEGNELDPEDQNNTSDATTLIGEFNKVYLPIIIKPAPTILSIQNATSPPGIVTVIVRDLGGTEVTRCTVNPGATVACDHDGDGSNVFPPGTYNHQITQSPCGTGTFPKTYASGPQVTKVVCN